MSRFSPVSQLVAMISRQELLDVLWERIPMMAVDITADESGRVVGSGRILTANQAVERLFGYDMLGSMRGLLVEELVPLDRVKRHEQHVSSFAQNPTHRAMGHRGMELLGRRRDGTTFPLSIELVPAMLQEVPCTIVVFAEHGVGNHHDLA